MPLQGDELLAPFPNSIMTVSYLRGPGQVPPATARRAAEFIDGHACQPLTLTGLAVQVGVTPRALAAPPYPPPLSLRHGRKPAMVTLTPLRRVEFASCDPLEIRNFLHRVRGSRMLLNGTRDRGWRVSLTQVDAGHRQLQAADPDRDSVTAVAYRWGFSSPSRFASYYRRVFGVQPSHTLRS